VTPGDLPFKPDPAAEEDRLRMLTLADLRKIASTWPDDPAVDDTGIVREVWRFHVPDPTDYPDRDGAGDETC
jgi:hypothetical protein